nr:hypothetical protein [Pseudonocardia oroxyli]
MRLGVDEVDVGGDGGKQLGELARVWPEDVECRPPRDRDTQHGHGDEVVHGERVGDVGAVAAGEALELPAGVEGAAVTLISANEVLVQQVRGLVRIPEGVGERHRADWSSRRSLLWEPFQWEPEVFAMFAREPDDRVPRQGHRAQPCACFSHAVQQTSPAGPDIVRTRSPSVDRHTMHIAQTGHPVSDITRRYP